MQRSVIFALSAVTFVALVPLACTQDFGSFEPIGGPDTAGGSGGSGSSGASSSPTSTGSGSDGIQCSAGSMCDDENPCTNDGCTLTSQTCFHKKVDGPAPQVNDGNPCTEDVCNEGVEQHINLPKSQSCGSNLFCNGAGSCVGCTSDEQCSTASECQTPTCSNSKCSVENAVFGTPCAGGKCNALGACVECLNNFDCKGGAVCVNGTCGADACTNGKQDNGETDVDCGGNNCPGCATGEKCNNDTDCATDSCANNFCGGVPLSCLNNEKDGGETDIDCGGVQCAKCGLNKACITGADCLSGKCTANFCK